MLDERPLCKKYACECKCDKRHNNCAVLHVPPVTVTVDLPTFNQGTGLYDPTREYSETTILADKGRL